MNYVEKILERTVNLGIRDYGVCCRIDIIDAALSLYGSATRRNGMLRSRIRSLANLQNEEEQTRFKN